uniref:FHA domain-containing protein n=1 Tax=Manihot esculenta TaxID=3983 RepID=A0A2C9TZR4_MANES
MGALAPVSPWMPEDDLLLKNAVEAGASLESLAKGAVQFSQKFTVREIQERWHSLLYDPIVSAEAAFHMIEFERSASTLPSKFCRVGNTKKRKAESVRSCYYALRKRIRNEPFNSMDLSFLIAPTDSNYMGNEDEPFSGHCILGDPVPNHFVLQESNLDIMQLPFPQIVDDTAAHSFHAQFQNTIQEDFPVEQDNVHKEIPQICGENMLHARNGSVIEEFGGPKELAANSDQVHECSKFGGDQAFSSPIPECAVSFHNLDYSSPLPEMPIWKTVEGGSPPSIPVSMHTGDPFSLPGDDDTKNTCLSEYGSNLKLEIPSEEMKNVAASTEGYLAELSNSLLNFTNEEELLFTDVDGKDAIDKSYYDGLSSLLLSSPNGANQDHMANITEPEVANVTELESSVNPDYLINKSGAGREELDEDRGSHHSCDAVGDSDVHYHTSASSSNPQFPEMGIGVIICTLNTEDPDIPCNDDVVFTKHLRPKSFSSIARQNVHDVYKPNPSTKEFSVNTKTSEGGSVLIQGDIKNPGQSHACSQVIRSRVVPEISSLHPVGDGGVKFDLPSSSSTHKNVSVGYGGSSLVHSANASAETVLPAKLKKEAPEAVPVKHFSHDTADASMEKTNASDVKLDLDAPPRFQTHQASHAKLGSTEIAPLEHGVNHTPDPEEPPIESDDDVPYFSDIEAMILGMDLDPEEKDLYSSEEVSRYQHEDIKRVIIRLEQGAHSYVQRAIASQGAIAVLYGRYSKHYIKKPEVLLGRATEDVIVDIDLGREGRANKISRRQATIYLDKGGSFHLKNLGKCSISVNDKEIAPGQSLNLTSSCVIEIRGMPFIFETNQSCVKQYLDSVTQKNQKEEH